MFPIAGLFVLGGSVASGTLAGTLLGRDTKKSLPSWLRPASSSDVSHPKNVEDGGKRNGLSLRKQQPVSESGVDKSPGTYSSHTDLLLSAVTVGLTLAGRVVFPPLNLVTIPLQIYLCRPYYKDAYRQIFVERKVKMAVLDTVVSSLMLVSGYYFLNSVYLFMFNLSAKLIDNARQHSMNELVSVFNAIPRTAWVLIDEVEVQRSVEMLLAGDMVVVHPGETIPADGKILSGLASVDQHMLTGESQPTEKAEGDPVFASTILLSGRICISVERAGTDTVAAQIESILNNTASYHSNLELRGQKIADQYALPVLLAGGLTLPLLGASSAVAVLLSDFGYRMRFIGPLSVLNYLTLVTEENILVKDGRALESLQTVDTFVFDKTGTLTQKQPHVSQIHTCPGHNETEVMRNAAAAEHRQTHPIARAILAEAHARSIDLPAVDGSSYELGYGLRVQVEGKTIRVGSQRFMKVEQIPISTDLQSVQERCHSRGHSLVYVATDGEMAGAIELHATIRPEVAEVVAGLHERGMTLYVISGDHEEPTRQLAESLGIDHFFAQVLPEDKADLITKLQAEGRQVCFVGDGINDSIALKKANVSVSLSGASTIATDTAQVVLMDGTLSRLIPLYDLAKSLQKNMQFNFLSSLIPGIICIGGVYFLHWGVVAAGVISYISLGTGVGNAFRPIWGKKSAEVVEIYRNQPLGADDSPDHTHK